jgi:hypothetical protein
MPPEFYSGVLSTSSATSGSTLYKQDLHVHAVLTTGLQERE